MKRKAPPAKIHSAAHGVIPPVAENDSVCVARRSDGVNICLGLRKGSSVKMSEADFDHYKFLVDLNQQSRLGLTRTDLLGLIYDNNCVPWTGQRRCSCTAIPELVGKKDDKNTGDGDRVASDCRHGTSSMLSKRTLGETQSPDAPRNSALDNFQNVSLICAACEGVRICGSKESETANTKKFEGPSCADASSIPGGLITLPRDPVPQIPRRRKCSKYCVCILFGDPCPRQRKTKGGEESQKSNLLSSILCSCSGSTSVPSNGTCRRQIECTHEDFIHCEPSVETVGPNGIMKNKPSVPDLSRTLKATELSPIVPESGTLEGVEDPHERCCRIIRLSEREHLLLCQFEKAQKWGVRLNILLKRYSVRIFLLRRRQEIHVRGVENFEHAKIQILKEIRNATAWWDSERKKVEHADFTMQYSLVQHDPVQKGTLDIQCEKNLNNYEGEMDQSQQESRPDVSSDAVSASVLAPVDCMTPQGLPTSPDFVLINDEGCNFASVQDTITASTDTDMYARSQETAYPLQANTDEQICHTFVLNQGDHQRLKNHDRRRSIITELNRYLIKQNMMVHLSDKQRELHIFGYEQDRQKALQIVWEAAPDPKLQRRILPIFALIETPSSGNCTTADAQREFVSNNGPMLPRSSVYGCADYPDCVLEGPSRCYSIPLDTLADYGILSESEGLMENINAQLGKHGISICLLSEKAELHIKCGMEDVDRTCAILIEAARDHDVAQYFPVSLKSYLITSPAYAERIIAPQQQSSAFTANTSPCISGPTYPFGQLWANKDYPERLNQWSPRGQIIPINPNDETHATLIDWNRVNKFVSRLNDHFSDLGVTVRLLEAEPEFQVFGQCAQVVIPTLMDITTGIRNRYDIMTRLLFLYPGFAKKINRGWNRGERGPCKCHGTANIVDSVPAPVITSSDNPTSAPRTKRRNRRPRKKSKGKSALMQPSREDKARPGGCNLFPPPPNNGGNLQYPELTPTANSHYLSYDPNSELYHSSLLLPSDRVIRDRYSQSLFPRQ